MDFIAWNFSPMHIPYNLRLSHCMAVREDIWYRQDAAMTAHDYRMHLKQCSHRCIQYAMCDKGMSQSNVNSIRWWEGGGEAKSTCMMMRRRGMEEEGCQERCWPRENAKRVWDNVVPASTMSKAELGRR